MTTLHVAPSDDLDADHVRAFRRLLDDAFAGDFSDDDWAHAWGGVHVWVSGPAGVVSHGALVARTLGCAGTSLRVGYVEAVATLGLARRRGHGAAVMTRIGALIAERYPLGALSTGTPAFYESLGWRRWRGATFGTGPQGVVPTPDDDGGVMILTTPGSPVLDLDGPIVADWRAGDVW